MKRRSFIKGASAFGGIMFLPSLAAAKVKGANDKFNVALIGVGGIGNQAIMNFQNAPQVKIAAGCDVDDARAAKCYAKLPDGLPRYKDYRVLLDKMDKDIDGVVVSTPDHTHFAISAWAMAKGKHVFCQKPLARTIHECRELKRLAKKAGVFTQMGNQGHSHHGWRIIREWHEAGILGDIEDVYIWTDRPAGFWEQGEHITKEKYAAEKIPSTLDYNLWLGVAPLDIPYNHNFAPFGWRGLCAFGTGAMGDMACHLMDVPYSAFQLSYPTKVKSSTTPFNGYSWPAESTISMEFESAFGVGGKLRIHWYDGLRRPKEIKRIGKDFLENPKNKNRTVIVGTKETVVTDEYGSEAKTFIWPREKMIELKKSNALPKATLERSETPGNAHLEWALNCIKGVNSPANFDYAAPFTETALLGMIATRFPEAELAFDGKNFKNNSDANKFIFDGGYANREEFLPKGFI